MTIYLINRLLKSYITIPVIDYICKCHLNDFIGGIVFCIYTNIILVLFKRKPIINIKILLIYMTFVSFIWEYIFPLFLPYSTSDFFDVIAYLLGTILYYLLTIKVVRNYKDL